jgi:tape measure domain-containing protein
MAIVLNNSLYWQARIDYNTLRNDIAQVHNLMNQMNTRVQSQGAGFNSMFTKLGAGFAAFFSVQQAGQFINSLIEVRGQFQMLDVAFSTILRSKEKADALMKEMITLSLETPFELKDVAGGAKQLLAYGFQAEKITETITMLGNVASGVGAPLNDIIYLYGTLQTQGRAYTKDIMQFTGRGIPIIGELAKQFGVANTQIQKMVEGGKIGFKEVEKAFQSMTGQGGMFENLMQKQAKTLPGLISNMKDAWSQLLNEWGKDTEGFFAGVIKGATNMINELTGLYKDASLVGGDASLTFLEKSSMLIRKAFGGKEFDKVAGEEAAIENQSKVLFDDYVNRFKNTIKSFTTIAEASAFADKEYDKILGQYQEAKDSHFEAGSKVTKTVLSQLEKEILFFKEMRKNQETFLGGILFPGDKDNVSTKLGVLPEIEQKIKDINDAIEELNFTPGWENELEKLTKEREKLELLKNNLLNYVNRGEFDFLKDSSVPTPLYIKPNATTGVSKGQITPLNKDNYVQDLNFTKDFTRQKQLAYKHLFDSIDDLDRKSLLNRLNSLKIELQLTKLTAEERIEIERKIAEVTDALNGKTVRNLEMVADALIEIGNLAGGKTGEQLAKLGNSLGSAVQGFASQNYVQAVAGVVGFAQQFGDLLSGATKEAREQELYYESQAKWLEYMSRELQKQIDLTNELQGIEIYSGFEQAIANTDRDIAEIEKRLRESAKLLTGFKYDNGFLGIGAKQKPIFADVSKLTIDELKKLIEQANANEGASSLGFLNPEDLKLVNEYVDQLEAAQKQATELRNKFNETITGSTYEGLLSSIKEGFEDGELSAQELADFTEDAMKKAMMKSFEIEFLQEQMQNWYDAFAEANEDGKITTDERAKLVKDFQDEMSKANEELKLMSDSLGIDFSKDSASKTTMAGSIKGLTEETGGKIEGAFNGVRLTNLQLLNVAQKHLEKITLIEQHTYTLYEIRDLIKRGNSSQLTNDRAYGI